jgi:hypothetical protein
LLCTIVDRTFVIHAYFWLAFIFSCLIDTFHLRWYLYHNVCHLWLWTEARIINSQNYRVFLVKDIEINQPYFTHYVSP